MTGSDEPAYAAALAGLPGMGPATLNGLLASLTPAEAWQEIRAGRIRRPTRRSPPASPLPGFGPTVTEGPTPGGTPEGGQDDHEWARAAARVDPPAWWSAHARRGIRVTWPGDRHYPAALEADPERPGALFWLGSLDVLDRPCVAVVGTRSATLDGRGIAFEMGRGLAAAGVCVVSGMALGIDGQAHAGALKAVEEGAPGTTVAVAASGVDVPYPRQHAGMWSEVTRVGAVISENLPGRAAQAWRFPSRNRVIAGLVRLVVVVESHQRGGSLITAEAAIARGVEVRVVPGPVRSPASAGSNQLLYDGPGPVRDARDVLDALGIFQPDPDANTRSRQGASRPTAAGAPRLPPPGPDRKVLDAIGWRAATIGQVIARSGLSAAAVAAALDRLTGVGAVGEEGGYWSRKF
jgi:DNA processing protein